MTKALLLLMMLGALLSGCAVEPDYAAPPYAYGYPYPVEGSIYYGYGGWGGWHHGWDHGHWDRGGGHAGWAHGFAGHGGVAGHGGFAGHGGGGGGGGHR